MRFSNPEDILAITPSWKGERFEDGRPKVPDRYLDALYGMTLEELWKPIFVQGYENQFIAIKSLHPEFKEDGTVYRLAYPAGSVPGHEADEETVEVTPQTALGSCTSSLGTFGADDIVWE